MTFFPLRSPEGPNSTLRVRMIAAFGGIVLGLALQCVGQTQAPAPTQPDAQQSARPEPSQQPASAAQAPTDAAPQPASVATPPSDGAQQPASAAPASSNTVLHPAEAIQTPSDIDQQAGSPAQTSPPKDGKAGAITEDEVKRLFLGKTVYLRDGYLDSALSFDEYGKLIGHSPQGSYTLNLVEIQKVRLSKHKLELAGIRYGLHFLGARPDEDPTKAVDKVRITPKKKVVKIAIDRELVIVPKKKKPKKSEKAVAGSTMPKTATVTASGAQQLKTQPDGLATLTPAGPNDADKAAAATQPSAPETPAPSNSAQASTETKTAPDPATATANGADQAKAETGSTSATTPSNGDKAGAEIKTASAPAGAAPRDANRSNAKTNTVLTAVQPGNSASITTTTSPAHAARLLRGAIDRIFAEGLDGRMIAAMPDFWKLYYQAVADRADYKPIDPLIYRQNDVDQKAKLLSALEPSSNEYAQNGGVAGMALYHAVIGADGKPQEIVVGRPIGFGLDESAADTIRKASFQPAMKDGKAVAVVLDLVVQFRIYSKRTDQGAKPEAKVSNSGQKLPGPYSATHQ